MKNFLALIQYLKSNFSINDEEKLWIEKYFEKYQRQKKTANILLGTGSVLALSGFIVASTDSGTRGSLFFSTNQIVELILIISGVTSALVSIPFYISAEKNKRKSLTIQPTFQLENEKYTQEKSAKVGVAITF